MLNHTAVAFLTLGISVVISVSKSPAQMPQTMPPSLPSGVVVTHTVFGLNVDARSCRISAADFQKFAALGKLNSLDVRQCQIGDDELSLLVKNIQTRSLCLSSNVFSEEGSLVISELNGLVRLDLHFCSGVTDKTIREVAKLTNLVQLDLSDTEVTTVGLSFLKPLKKLGSLNLSDSKIDKEAGSLLVELSSLRRLSLSRTTITDHTMHAVGRLMNLTDLSVCDTDVGDEGIYHICSAKKIEALNLGRTRVTKKGVAHLQSLAYLTDLVLRQNRLNDDAAGDIAKLRHIRRLDIQWTEIGDRGLELISNMPELRKITFGDLPDGPQRISSKGLFSLAKCRSLKEIEAVYIRIDPESVSRFKKLRPDIELTVGAFSD